MLQKQFFMYFILLLSICLTYSCGSGGGSSKKKTNKTSARSNVLNPSGRTYCPTIEALVNKLGATTHGLANGGFTHIEIPDMWTLMGPRSAKFKTGASVTDKYRTGDFDFEKLLSGVKTFYPTYTSIYDTDVTNPLGELCLSLIETGTKEEKFANLQNNLLVKFTEEDDSSCTWDIWYCYQQHMVSLSTEEPEDIEPALTVADFIRGDCNINNIQDMEMGTYLYATSTGTDCFKDPDGREGSLVLGYNYNSQSDDAGKVHAYIKIDNNVPGRSAPADFLNLSVKRNFIVSSVTFDEDIVGKLAPKN